MHLAVTKKRQQCTAQRKKKKLIRNCVCNTVGITAQSSHFLWAKYSYPHHNNYLHSLWVISQNWLNIASSHAHIFPSIGKSPDSPAKSRLEIRLTFCDNSTETRCQMFWASRHKQLLLSETAEDCTESFTWMRQNISIFFLKKKNENVLFLFWYNDVTNEVVLTNLTNSILIWDMYLKNMF